MKHPKACFVAPATSSLLIIATLALAAPTAAVPAGPGPAAPACSVEQLTQTEGDHGPTLDVDGDGDRLVVTSRQGLDGGNIGGNNEVWLWAEQSRTDQNPAGFLQMTETQNGNATSATISDDGQVIAFTSGANLVANTNADGNQELFTWDLGAGSLEQQTFSAGGAGNQGADVSGDGDLVAWSSDRDLVGQNDNGRSQIFRLDLGVPGAVEEQVTAVGPTATAADPAVSHDGSVISFTSDMEIVGGNVDRGVEQWRTTPIGGFELLTSSPATAGFQHPTSISADGRHVVFADPRVLEGNTERNREIWRAGLGTLEPVTAQESGDSRWPSIDGAGGRVAFSSTSRISFEEPGNETEPDLFVVDVARGSASQVTPPDVPATYVGDVAMSADGTRIGFVSDLRTQSNQDGNREVFLATCGRPGQVFRDVPAGHVFAGPIAWMAETGISTGYQPGPTYRPAAPVTRGAMAAFLFRLAGRDPAENPPPATPTFRDVDEDHPFFLEIEWMAAAGITTGNPDGTYGFAAPVSRGAMSAFLYRLAGSPDITLPPGGTFDDVGPGHPFFRAVEWMWQQGIARGYPTVQGLEYRPAEPVTRQAMSAFLQRAKLAYPAIGQS